MARRLVLLCCCASLSVVAVVAQQAAKPATPAANPADGPLLAGQVFKNVPALGDMPVDDFLPMMGLMTASVGGDCATCHVGAGTQAVNWPSDAFPIKKRAREMAFMVRKINKETFGGRTVVTCWTCHRGRSIPIQTPTLSQVYGEPDLSPEDLIFTTAQGLPAPGPILDRYLQAIGGAAKVTAITSYLATGVSQGFRGFGGGGQVSIYAKAPDQRSMIIEYKAEGRDATVRSYDGKLGWIKTPLNILGEYQLGGDELDGARLDAQLTFPGQVKTALTRLRTLEVAEIDGKEMDVVQGNGPRRVFATLYFDKTTGLLRRLVRFGQSPIGRLPTQLDFDDYRDVNGVKMPFKMDFVWLDGRDQIQLNDVKLNVAIDAAKFGKPTALEKKK